MGLLDTKPPGFKAGDMFLNEDDLNKIVDMLIRRISPRPPSEVSYFGDRVVIGVKDPIPNLPGVSNYLSQFVVLQELDDYILCTPYQAPFNGGGTNLTIPIYNPTAGIGSLITVAVAKPYWLQKTPWDGQTVIINGLSTTFHYTGLGLRNAVSAVRTDLQELSPSYVPGDIITAAKGTPGNLDGQSVPIPWVDVNAAGRTWTNIGAGASLISVDLGGTLIGLRPAVNFIASTNMTIVAADNSIQDRVDVTFASAVTVDLAGSLVGVEPILNFIAGSNVTLTVTNNAGANRVDITIAASGGGGGSLTVQDVSTSPSYAGTTTLEFDATTGVQLTQPSGGIVLASLLAASPTQWGVVTNGTLQTFIGAKAWKSSLYFNESTFWTPVGWSGLADTGPIAEANYVSSLQSNGADDGFVIVFSSNVNTDSVFLEFDATGHSLVLITKNGSTNVDGTYGVVDGTGTTLVGVWGTNWDGLVVSGGIVTTLGAAYTPPGAGTYTTGAALTPGVGVNGTITVDAYGRITAVQQAT